MKKSILLVPAFLLSLLVVTPVFAEVQSINEAFQTEQVEEQVEESTKDTSVPESQNKETKSEVLANEYDYAYSVIQSFKLSERKEEGINKDKVRYEVAMATYNTVYSDWLSKNPQLVESSRNRGIATYVIQPKAEEQSSGFNPIAFAAIVMVGGLGICGAFIYKYLIANRNKFGL